jgi:outer membrane receptor protein involved in Fe transport
VFNKYIVILFLLASYTNNLFAQSAKEVRGKVLNTTNSPIAGVIVTLNQQQNKTDDSGNFSFDHIPSGQFIIAARAVGYTAYIDTLTKTDNESLFLTITLLPTDHQLEEVVVQGKTDNQKAKEKTIRAIVIDTKENAEQPVTLAELMNRAAGIRIRQSSGLGNQVDISINGFQGNSLQYFRDGIPMEYLGEGYGIQHVPIN